MENLIISKDIGRTAVEKSVGKKREFFVRTDGGLYTIMD